MDSNDSLGRRFSLNMTHLPNPIAESTCLNLNGSTTRNVGRMRSAADFQWGGSPISPKNFSNSSLYMNNTSAVHKSRSTSNSPQRARMNLRKIDPRIYADVQSRGLASRIVQYHENGSRLNRSKSAINIYSKSEQHSIAQLQKNELPYRATQQSVTMTRIAAPKKSVFHGNTLSSLLRSNSVISLQKSNEELSCENRPILHPPPTENELAPTRSVLDVLKEISRKRINNDDSDGVHDANKKYCNRECNDTPYEQTPHFADQRNIGAHAVGVASGISPMSAAPGTSHKRQREPILAPQHQPFHYTHHLNRVPNGNVGVNTRSTLHTQHSPPEQIAKKRLCNYNNDITSSLSSSLIHANKRKFYEQQQRSSIQHSPPSLVEEYEAQKSKIQRQQADLRLQQLTKSLSCNTPITPLPTTPFNLTNNVPAISGNIEHETEEPPARLKQTLSEPPRLNDNFSSKQQKPKLTLFNRDYDNEQNMSKIKGNEENLPKNDGDEDNGECADIQFVKPKKSSAIVNKINPLIERTQKSKLAMMLSGLRGEIYQGDEGEDRADKTIAKKSQSNLPNQSNPLVSKENNSVGNSVASPTNFPIKATPNSAISTPATGAVNLIPITTEASSISTTTSSTSVTTMISTGGSSPSSTSNTSVSTNVSPPAVLTAVAKSASPLVGIKLNPQKKVLDTNGKQSKLSPTFNFGAPSSAASNDSTKSVAGTITGLAAVTQLQGFSFGVGTKSTASTIAASTATFTTVSTAATTAASNVGGFKLDAAATQTATTLITTTTAVTPPTFSGFANVSASTTTTVSKETPKPVFAFGSGAANFVTPTSTTTATKRTFNIGGITSTATPTTTTTAIFGAIGTNTFTLGSTANNSSKPTTAAVAPSTVTTNTPNLFGGGAFAAPLPASTTNKFSFGATPTTTQATATNAILSATNTNKSTAATHLFSFGGDKSAAASSITTPTTNPTPFAFGANIQTAANTVSTSTNDVNKPVFSFSSSGGSVAANPPTSETTNKNTLSGNLFSFGGNKTSDSNNTQSSSPNAASQSSAFSFGAVAAQTSTPVFGAASAIASPPAFGAPKATSSTTPFAFGGGSSFNNPSATTSVAAPNAAPTAGGFSFGATNPQPKTNNAAPTNIFGAAASTLTNNPPLSLPSNTNIVKPSFNFGGGASANTNNSTNDAANKSIFGGAAANTNANNNLFGSFAPTSERNSQANKTFSFNTNTDSHNKNATPNNPFAPAALKPSVGGFSFNANTSNNKPAAAPSASAPFAFGGTANNTAASTTSTPFSFGGSTNNSNGAPPNKTFTFCSTNNVTDASTMSSGSIFGGGVTQTTNNTQQAAVPPFNFSAGSNVAAPASGSANIFAPPVVSSTGGSGDRPIRRATRRLQKT